METAVLLLLGIPLLVILPIPFSPAGAKVYGEAIVLSVMAAAGLAGLVRHPSSGLPRRVFLGAALLVLWAILSLAWTPSAHQGLQTLVSWIPLAGATVLMLRTARTRVLDAGITAALAIASLYAAGGFLQFQGVLPREHWAGPHRPAGPFVNSNMFAAYLLAHLFVLAGSAVDARGIGRAVRLVGASLCGAAVVLTASRGGWMAGAAGTALLCLLLARAFRTVRARAAWFGAVALLAVAVLGVLFRLGAIAEISERVRAAGTYSFGHRAKIWKDTAAMVAHAPWGAGAGMFVHVFPQHRTFSDRFVVNFAHSDPLELASDLGLPGLAAGVFLAVGIGSLLARARRGPPGLRSGLIASCLSVAVTSLYDFPLHQPAVAFSLLWLVCLGLRRLEGDSPGDRRPVPWRISAAWLAAVAACAVFSAMNARAALLSHDAERRSADGRFIDAARLRDRAYRWSLGDFEAARSAGDDAMKRAAIPIDQRRYLEQARDYYRKAARSNPVDAESHFGVALTSDSLGDVETAEKEYRIAQALDPFRGRYAEYAGFFLLRRGRVTEGISTYARSCAFELEHVIKPAKLFDAIPPDPKAEKEAIRAQVDAGILKTHPELLGRMLRTARGADDAAALGREVEEAAGPAAVVYYEMASRRFPASNAIRERLAELRSHAPAGAR